MRREKVDVAALEQAESGGRGSTVAWLSGAPSWLKGVEQGGAQAQSLAAQAAHGGTELVRMRVWVRAWERWTMHGEEEEEEVDGPEAAAAAAVAAMVAAAASTAATTSPTTGGPLLFTPSIPLGGCAASVNPASCGCAGKSVGRCVPPNAPLVPACLLRDKQSGEVGAEHSVRHGTVL